MRPLDYKLLQALNAVVRAQSFERAADSLNLTQSAVSQRIKQLEEQIAQPLLIRSQPLAPTQAGQKLLGHYQQVSQLQRELMDELVPTAPTEPIAVSIAVNADSLATWFIPALTPLLISHPIELELVIAGESRTQESIRKGEVFAAISSQREPAPGCQADLLGKMDYCLVASPDFRARHFPRGPNKKALRRAPGVDFDQRDSMHASYIERHFKLSPGGYPCHTVHSSEAFVTLALEGAAYCLIPAYQIGKELASGRLVDLLPNKHLVVPLYWHRWALEKGLYKQISDQIIDYSRSRLRSFRTRAPSRQ